MAANAIQATFRRFGPEYLAEFQDAMPPHHRRALGDIMACRRDDMGGHIESCKDCGDSHFVPHSCRNAICPLCHGAQIQKWIAARADEILPVPYFHVTFPLPAELREVARSHYRVICGAMLQAAAEALQTLAADRHGGRLGIIAVLHTWGRNLPWHPHVHCLIPGVVLEGKNVKKLRPNYLLPLRPLSTIYRAVFLRIVRADKQAPELPHIPWSKGWIVHCRPCEEGPGNVLRYLARYTKRGPLPDSAIESVDERGVTFRFRSHRTKRQATCRVKPQEFLRRYLQHTPPLGFHRIRYYGLLAPGARRSLRALRVLFLTGLLALAALIGELKAAADKHGPRKCPKCGGVNLDHGDFQGPNRRAPPWTA